MKTRSINTRILTGTQLMGVDFNSGTMFNGRLYFASADGLKREDGSRDGELDIKAWIVIPTTDMDVLQPKGLRTLTLLGRFGGRVQVTVENETSKEIYLSPELNATTGIRMKVDRELRGWAQKIKIANYDGCSVNLSKGNITIIPGAEIRR